MQDAFPSSSFGQLWHDTPAPRSPPPRPEGVRGNPPFSLHGFEDLVHPWSPVATGADASAAARSAPARGNDTRRHGRAAASGGAGRASVHTDTAMHSPASPGDGSPTLRWGALRSRATGTARSAGAGAGVTSSGARALRSGAAAPQRAVRSSPRYLQSLLRQRITSRNEAGGVLAHGTHAYTAASGDRAGAGVAEPAVRANGAATTGTRNAGARTSTGVSAQSLTALHRRSTNDASGFGNSGRHEDRAPRMSTGQASSSRAADGLRGHAAHRNRGSGGPVRHAQRNLSIDVPSDTDSPMAPCALPFCIHLTAFAAPMHTTHNVAKRERSGRAVECLAGPCEEGCKTPEANVVQRLLQCLLLQD